MTNIAHAVLAGSDLHEPKGIGSAANNTSYIANGAGSGAWIQIQPPLFLQVLTRSEAA